jgi:hypothetical protein
MMMLQTKTTQCGLDKQLKLATQEMQTKYVMKPPGK